MRETEREWEGEAGIYREKEMEWEVVEKWREPAEVGIYFRMDNMDLLHNSFLLKFL